MRVRIARALHDRILAEAAAEPDREVCGLLLGDAGRILAIRPAENVAPDPARHFEVDPRLLFATIRAERAGGPALIGHYHSHPSGAARPSARDAADAVPGPLWLVVGGGRIGAFRFAAGDFVAVELVLG